MTQVNPAIVKLTQTLYDAICSKCRLPLRIIKDLNEKSESKVSGGSIEA
jgi:hypothetical protein